MLVSNDTMKAAAEFIWARLEDDVTDAPTDELRDAAVARQTAVLGVVSLHNTMAQAHRELRNDLTRGSVESLRAALLALSTAWQTHPNWKAEWVDG